MSKSRIYSAVLEEISDRIRRGECVSFAEAVAAIDYQEFLKLASEERRRNAWWRRAIRMLMGKREARDVTQKTRPQGVRTNAGLEPGATKEKEHATHQGL